LAHGNSDPIFQIYGD